jgi:hypothetical protein
LYHFDSEPACLVGIAGFLLPQVVARGSIRYQQFLGTFVGTFKFIKIKYQHGGLMALTDTFIRQVRHSGAPAGDKHSDGGGMHLLVKESGKYWRLSYRFSKKQKTLALGVLPGGVACLGQTAP